MLAIRIWIKTPLAFMFSAFGEETNASLVKKACQTRVVSALTVFP